MVTASRARRRALVLLALLGGLLVVGGVASPRAGAATTTSMVAETCSIVGVSVPTSMAIEASAPDATVAGSVAVLRLRPALPVLYGFAEVVDSATFVIPMPGQVAAVEDVTLSGGSVAGTSTVDGTTVSVALTGPADGATLQLPEIAITARLAAEAAGQTIAWQPPSSFTAQLHYKGFPMTVPCTPDAGQAAIASSSIEAPTTTTTTTTTTPAVSTTVPPTTTPAVTTTVPPTTSGPDAPATGWGWFLGLLWLVVLWVVGLLR